MFRRHQRGRPEHPMFRSARKRAIRQQHGHRSGTSRKRRHRLREFLHSATRSLQQPLQHDFIDLPRGFARDHQPSADLAEFDAICHFDHSVQHAQACITDIVNDGTSLHADSVRHRASRRRLEILPAHPRVNHHSQIGRITASFY